MFKKECCKQCIHDKLNSPYSIVHELILQSM